VHRIALGWHTEPIPTGLRPEDIRYSNYDTYGRAVAMPQTRKGRNAIQLAAAESPPIAPGTHRIKTQPN